MVTRKIGRRIAHKERKGVAIAPINTLRLMEACGVTRAAHEMGTSTTTLHKARKSNLISKSLEIAANSVLRELLGGDGHSHDYEAVQHTAAPKQRTTTFMLEVAPEKAEIVEKMADVLGAKLLRA